MPAEREGQRKSYAGARRTVSMLALDNVDESLMGTGDVERVQSVEGRQKASE